ncbi:histidine kinase, partial [Burkholderia pseudomallei]
HHYTTIAIPCTSSPISVIDDPFAQGLLSDQARVRGFNASPNAQIVDIYVVPPGTNIAAQSPTLAGAAYQYAVAASGQDSIYLSGGTYQ